MSYNRFKNGYTCQGCKDEREKEGFTARSLINNPLTPVYLRVDRKFEFAGLVVCEKHGDPINHFAPAIALRDL